MESDALKPVFVNETLYQEDDVKTFFKRHAKALNLSGASFNYHGSLWRNPRGKMLEEVVYGTETKTTTRGPFWYRIENENTKEVTMKMIYRDFLAFLEAHGYFRRILPDNRSYDYVHVQDGIVTMLYNQTDRLQEFIRNYLEKHNKLDALEMIYRGSSTHFSESKIRNLKTTPIFPIKDDKHSSWLFFDNTALKITRDAIQEIPYEQLDGHVWQQQIINRKWSKTTPKKAMMGDWARFQMLAWNGIEDFRMHDALTEDPKALDEQQDRALMRQQGGMCANGYMVHRFKDPSVTKAVIMVDKGIADSLEEANGGSGKSISGEAFQHLRNRIEFSGRNLKMDKNFVLSRINMESDLVHIVDARYDFKVDDIFNWTTNAIIIERKKEHEFLIPYSDSPKWLIDTNYVPGGWGSSYRRRMYIIEFSDHWSDTNLPINYFGASFFYEWNDEQWQYFDNYYALCVQLYLRHGLLPYPTDNWELRRLKDSMPKNALEFLDENLSLETKYILQPVPPGMRLPDGTMNLLDTMQLYGITGFRGTPLDSTMLLRWVRHWVQFKGYLINGADPSRDKIPRKQTRIGLSRIDLYEITDPEQTSAEDPSK